MSVADTPDIAKIADEAERLLDQLAAARNVSRAQIVASLAERERARRADAETSEGQPQLSPEIERILDENWEMMEPAMRYLAGR